MRPFVIVAIFAVFIAAAYAETGAPQDDWYRRHPMPDGMKSLVESRADDAVAVCRKNLIGKRHEDVRRFLGASDLNHGEEEYTYHPERKDGSVWILLVEFDGDRVCDILGEELLPAQTNKGPNQALLPTPTAVTHPAAQAARQP